MYDLVIIGSGPAGLTASIYASCFHLKHLVVGKEAGGQMRLAPDILNYPGLEEISGKELTERMVAQVKKRGGKIVVDSVVKITNSSMSSTTYKNFAEVGKNFSAHLPNSPASGGVKQVGALEKLASPQNSQSQSSIASSTFELETQLGNKYQAKAIILATGTERRKLNVSGEVEYTGKGVHYCATCERLDYRGKACGVVGGANSAVQAAVQLSQAAKKIYIIYRGEKLRGDPIWLEQVEKNRKIEVIYNTVVTEIVGDGINLTGVRLSSKGKVEKDLLLRPTSEESIRPSADEVGPPRRRDSAKQLNNEILPLDKLFIEIGGVPGTALVIPLGVEMDEGGYTKVNARMATNVPGVFAAGDLVSYGLSIEQISSAVGLGARAAVSAFAYIKKSKAPIVWGESQIIR